MGTDCLNGYDTLQNTYNTLVVDLESDANYLAGLAAKGQGSGTEYGYALDKFESYIDLATVTTNLINECDIKYYLEAISKATSNVAGFINQGVNTYYRMQDDDQFTEMETAFANEDVETSAYLLGNFIQDFLMAEIPDKSESGFYQDVGSLM